MGDVCSIKRGDLRQALVEYAQSATKDGTIETLSLRSVARELGVSSGAVYRHFPDKEALMIEVVRLGWMSLREEFHAIRPKDQVAASVDEALQRCFRVGQTYVSFAMANPTLWRLMFGRIGQICREVMSQDPDLLSYTVLDVAEECARDLHRLGLLDTDPCTADTRFLWSALHGAADLVQSGARLDSSEAEAVTAATVGRSLLALGCPKSVLGNSIDPAAAH